MNVIQITDRLVIPVRKEEPKKKSSTQEFYDKWNEVCLKLRKCNVDLSRIAIASAKE